MLAVLTAGTLPTAEWHFAPDYTLIPAPDAPEQPVQSLAAPMIAPPAWVPPRLYGQTASEVPSDLTHFPVPLAGPFSMELWLNDHVNRPVGVLIGGRDATGSTRWSLGDMSRLGNDKFDHGASLVFGPVTLEPTTRDHRLAPWRAYLHHLVGTYDGNRWRLYHNGQLVGEAEGLAQSVTDLGIAGYFGAEPFMRLPNLVRDAAFFDRALTPAEVATLWTVRQTEITDASRGTEPGLRFTAGPYLTPPGTTEQKLLWETNVPASASLDWGKSTAFDHHQTFATADRPHRATLGPLQPDTVYFYRVRATGADGAATDSGTLAFRTMPEPGAPLVFAAIGDTQERPFINFRLSQLAWEQRPHFLLIAGDLIGGEEDERRWHWTDEYFVGMGPLIARVPVLAARGNGDVDVADPARDIRLFTNFDRYHNQPDLGPDGEHRGYYSRVIGDAEFFVLGGNLALRERQAPGFRGEQRAWLASALARSTARWKIAVHHQPAWSADDDDYGDSYAGPTTGGDPEIRKDFVDLYERHGVDLVLSGHIHSYERSWPILNGKPACGGVTYIQIGGGGGDLERAMPVRSNTAAAQFRGHHVLLARLWKDRLELSMSDSTGAVRDLITLEPRSQVGLRCTQQSSRTVTK
ncbi:MULTISPECIES: metallophosphoesterase [unclassified Sphingobium]|uniref:metallophosphoesterase n=1 Tax=unclassified Sphingobium TaxID=2611147 RepID=UPI002224DB3A|nr:MULTISPECIES: metallophosphoesterase [unclassified Sphingobium]MCW2416986.1 hypothetical protein [Sphingobium sp. B8D3A]